LRQSTNSNFYLYEIEVKTTDVKETQLNAPRKITHSKKNFFSIIDLNQMTQS